LSPPSLHLPLLGTSFFFLLLNFNVIFFFWFSPWFFYSTNFFLFSYSLFLVFTIFHFDFPITYLYATFTHILFHLLRMLSIFFHEWFNIIHHSPSSYMHLEVSDAFLPFKTKPTKSCRFTSFYSCLWRSEVQVLVLDQGHLGLHNQACHFEALLVDIENRKGIIKSIGHG
jgi:hypothetical protein